MPVVIRNVLLHQTKVNGTRSLHDLSRDGLCEVLGDVIAQIPAAKIQHEINHRDRSGLTPLLYACIGGDLDCTKLLLHASANLSLTSKKRRNILHYAGRSGNIDLFRFLLSEPDVMLKLDMYDTEGVLPIHLIAKSGNEELLKLVASLRPHHVMKTTNHGMNIVHFAAEKGHVRLTKKYLEEKWENLRFPPDTDGNSLLHFAAFSGRIELYKYVEEYFQRKDMPITRNTHGHLPIIQAAVSGNVELLEYMVSKETNILDEKSMFAGISPLFAGMQSRQLDSIRFLVDHSPSQWCEIDCQGRNIFHHAASCSSIAIMEYLLATIPNSDLLLTQLTDPGNHSILHCIIASKHKESLDLLKWLLTESNVSDLIIPLLELIDHDGASLLHTACQYGKLEILRFLLTEYESKFNIHEDMMRKSFLITAAENRFLHIISYLLSLHIHDVDFSNYNHDELLHLIGYCGDVALFRNAITQLHLDVNHQDLKGHTALHCAAQEGNYLGFQALCSLHADLFKESKEGVNVLHSAAFGGSLPIVKELVMRHFFDVNRAILHGDQSTPLHFATINLDKPMLDFLIANRADVNAVTVHQVSVLHDACRNINNIDPTHQREIVEYLLLKGAWKSLQVEASCGQGKQTPYDMASHNSVCKLLASRDPSFSIDHNLIPYTAVEKFLIPENVLGKGNFGSVYRGNLHGTPIAIKVLESQLCDVEYRFRVEVGIMTMIRHPNICMLMGACVETDAFCLIMEFIPVTLEALLPTLRLKDVVDYALDICRGMAWLHSRKPPILHCDLKADNILIDFGRAKVSDFGLATLFDPSSRQLIMHRKHQEFHRASSAPEVSTQAQFSIRSDIYSFGCCLFSMYWNGESSYSLDTAQVLIPIAGDDGSVIARVITKCCSHFASSRYESFQQIIEQLEPLLTLERITEEESFKETLKTVPRQPAAAIASGGYIEL